MKVSGVIVEYNPLHNGHLYHINKTKEITNSDVIIAVMSGNFNQRGIPSIIDKWTKTKTALLNGVDIVLELPAVYSLSSAEFFSFGAISLLNNLGVVDSICFGSEVGNIEFLKQVSSLLVEEPPSFKKYLKEELDKGLLFPKARSIALQHCLLKENTLSKEDLSFLLNSSNNILGIEYLKSLEKLHSNIKPYTIKREGGSYNSTNLNEIYSSATSIRATLKSKKCVSDLKHHLPDSVLKELLYLSNKGYIFPFEDMMYPFIKYKATTSSINNFKQLPDVSEGLHNKILTALNSSTSYKEAIDNIKSKRYAHTRISRILCQYYLNFYEYDIDSLRRKECSYARLLGFSEAGSKLLKVIKANSDIPLYSNIPKEQNETLKIDLQCTQGYSILNSSVRHNEDLLTKPIILK